MTMRLLLLSLCMIAVDALAEPAMLAVRGRAEAIDRWLGVRFETVLPESMRRAELGILAIVRYE